MFFKLVGAMTAVRSPTILQQLLLVVATVTGVVVGFSLAWLSPATSFQAGPIAVCHPSIPSAASALVAPHGHAVTAASLAPLGSSDSAGIAACSPGDWRRYGAYTGPCDVCGLAPGALQSVLNEPHDCESQAHWDGRWRAIRALRRQTKGPATCLILCAQHIPCRDPPCVLGFHARPGTTDGTVVNEVFFQGVFSNNISLPPAEAVLDAGANIGTVSVFLSLTYPNATIISVEASTKNFEILKLNTRMLPRTVAVHAALWSTVNDLCLFFNRRALGAGKEWGYRVYPCKLVPKSIKILERMQGITIPVLARMFDVRHFDVLKIDIEGAEGTVFHSRADTSFLKHGELVIMEIHKALWKGCTSTVKSAFRRTKRWLPSYRIGEHHVWAARSGSNETALGAS